MQTTYYIGYYFCEAKCVANVIRIENISTIYAFMCIQSRDFARLCKHFHRFCCCILAAIREHASMHTFAVWAKILSTHIAVEFMVLPIIFVNRGFLLLRRFQWHCSVLYILHVPLRMWSHFICLFYFYSRCLDTSWETATNIRVQTYVRMYVRIQINISNDLTIESTIYHITAIVNELDQAHKKQYLALNLFKYIAQAAYICICAENWLCRIYS